MEKDIFVELNFLIMIIDDALPKFDLPVDFVTDDSITGDILNQYGCFPCHIKAGVFVLCTRGTVRATINLSEYTITHNDFVTVLPDHSYRFTKYLRIPVSALRAFLRNLSPV